MQLVFERVEKKYLLTKEKMDLLLKELNNYLIEAEYTNYTICNIYYDTDNFDLIRKSLDKPLYKEKVRLRSYGIPNNNTKVFLEIKKKYKKVVHKRRITLPLSKMKKYLSNRNTFNNKNQVMKELDYLFDFYQLKPKLYLAYDRVAYIAKDNKDLRITFDHNIRSREDNLSLEAGDAGKLLLDKDTYLMEIKVPGAFPLYLSKALSLLEIYPVSFSKYGKVYEKKCYKEKEGRTTILEREYKKVKEEGVIYV